MTMAEQELVNKKALKKMRKKELRASIVCLYDEIFWLKDEIKSLKGSISEQDKLIEQLSNSLVDDIVDLKFSDKKVDLSEEYELKQNSTKFFNNSSIKIIEIDENTEE